MLQFQCGFCHTILTVPAQMAGVSGPCPSCGQTVTSPTPAPAAPPVQQWSPPPVVAQSPATPPAWPPAPPQSPVLGDLPRTSMPSPQPNPGLPPKRAPGQPPLTASLLARCLGPPLRHHLHWVPLMRLLDSLEQHCPISRASFLVLPHCQT